MNTQISNNDGAKTGASLPPRTCSAVLFLDVDGVLNASGKTTQRFHGLLGICPDMMARLLRILRETGCKVVLSSTWRKHPEHVKHLRENWGALGDERMMGMTPVLDAQSGAWLWTAQSRGTEIAAWLSQNPDVKHFVILDDDGDMAHLLPHLVQTDTFEGLTDRITDDVIRRLNERVSDSPDKNAI